MPIRVILRDGVFHPVDPVPSDWVEGTDFIALKVAPPPIPAGSSPSRSTIEAMAKELGVTDLGPLSAFLDEAEREANEEGRGG